MVMNKNTEIKSHNVLKGYWYGYNQWQLSLSPLLVSLSYILEIQKKTIWKVSDKYQVQEIQIFIKFAISYHKIKWYVSQMISKFLSK